MPGEPKSPYDIRDIFEEMTLSLIASLRRNLARHKDEETEEGFRWEMWQKAKLRALASFRKTNNRIVSGALKEAEQLTGVVLQQSFDAGVHQQETLWDRIVNAIVSPFGFRRETTQGEVSIPPDFKRTVPKPANPVPYEELPQAPAEENFFGLNDKKLGALQDGINADLRKAAGGALRMMDDVYRQVIYKTGTYMAAGVKSLNAAVDMATKHFLSRGIDCITYGDGRRVTIGAYAEMALRTLSQRATFMGEGKKRNEWGIYTVVMSVHDNCSEPCLPYQGTVMIDDVYSDGAQAVDPSLVLLSEAMRHNAFHPNCRHTLATYFPGISKPPRPANDELAEQNYAAEQRQRYMERQIRMYKRLEAGSLDPQNQAKYANKVTEWEGRLKEHLAEHDELRRDKTRERVDGEVPAAERKEILKLAAANAKIEETRKCIRSGQQPLNLHMGHQGKHIPGHNNYIAGKSYLTISAEEAQHLVNRYAGTGIINLTKSGEWKNTELVTSDKVVGRAIDQNTGEEFPTRTFKIHYGKKGVHIVPIRKE